MSGLGRAMVAASSPMKDPFGREIKSLRLSVTQRCDLRCEHCHREGQTPSDTEMTPGEIGRVVRVASSVGVRKVKLTGGEPLLRDDISEIVTRISPTVSEVSLTTNGTMLASVAEDLKRAGLRRVNVSLHSMNPETYESLCGLRNVDRVVDGIVRAVSAGLDPVKVNMVVFKDRNEAEIPQMIDFCGRVGAILQLIEYETDRESSNGSLFARRFCSLKGFEERLSAMAVETSYNELHRRKRYDIKANGHKVTVEVVRPMHNTEFCSNCTRIRMSSDGKIRPCLLDPGGSVDVLTHMRQGASDLEVRDLFVKAVANRRPYWR